MPGQVGNSGGKKGRSGRKPKFSEDELLDLINKAWSKEARLVAFQKLVGRASLGDLEALKLLMAYSYGKPKERHEITGKNGKDLIPVLNVTLNAEPEASKEADDSVSESSD